jgi:glutamine amidotransferase
LHNAHPFLYGAWAFAHNGTISDFDQHRQALEQEIDPAFRKLIGGETDSERCFYIFLTRLRAVAPNFAKVEAASVAAALAQTMRVLSQLTDRADLLSSMNFIVTNGRLMAATRRQRTLFVSDRSQHRSKTAQRPANDARLSQLVIASEELTSEDHWHPVPEEGIVSIDGDMRFRSWQVSELAPSPPLRPPNPLTSSG